MKYIITYSGWTTTEVEADSRDEAEQKFWDEGKNELFDANIDGIDPVINATNEEIIGHDEGGYYANEGYVSNEYAKSQGFKV